MADEPEATQVEIQRVGCVYNSKLFELENGRFGLMVDLAITNQTPRMIETLGVELRH